MTWVKICGMTNLEDALVAVEAGADALGFVFYEKSPRCVSVEAAREICEKLPERVEKIGVFVQGGEPDPVHVLLQAGLTGIQSHFTSGSAEPCSKKAIGVGCLPRNARFLVALPMSLFGGTEDIQHSAHNLADFGRNLAAGYAKNPPEKVAIPEGLMGTIMLDSGNLQQPGGTGKTFDWEKAVPFAVAMRDGGLNLVVAGGLNSENVGEAIEILHPWGVDVASGVEARPGRKDPEKVRAFVRAVREMDCRTR